MGEYLEMIENGGNMISFSYNCGRGSFSLDLNNASEVFSISDFKRFFAIAEESTEGVFAIAEKVHAFTAARLEYEKSLGVYKNGEKVIYGQNEKLVSKLEKILFFLSDSFGISCDVQKPEKITKKRDTGLIFNVDECGRRYAEAVTGDFYNVGGVWYFIHKKPEIKRGGYVLSAAAYGSRVAAFGYFKTAKDALAWIGENGISQKLLNPPTEGRARAAEMRARFLEAVENSGLSWVIERNPAYFEDFLTTAEAGTPTEGAEMPQNAKEAPQAQKITTAAEKTEEKPENAPTVCSTSAETEAPEENTAGQPATDPADLATAPTGCTKAAGNATARRSARYTTTTRQKPHIPPKMPRGYISTIDSAKALNGAKYAPTMARPTPPNLIGFWKFKKSITENHVSCCSCISTRVFVKNSVGFIYGNAPPWGHRKIFALIGGTIETL